MTEIWGKQRRGTHNNNKCSASADTEK